MAGVQWWDAVRREDHLTAKVRTGPWDAFHSWPCSDQAFPDEMTLKAIISCSTTPPPSCLHVQEEALSSLSRIVYQSPWFAHPMWRSPGLWCSNQGSPGGVVRRFGGKRAKSLSFISCVRGFLTKWLLFPLNDNLLFRTLEIKIKFWKRKTWYSGGRQILQQHKVRADSSGTSRLEDWCGAAQSGQTSELPAVVESWILLILFLSFKVTDSGTHGVYPP